MKKLNSPVIEFRNQVYFYYSKNGKIVRIPTGINWKERKSLDSKKILFSMELRFNEIITAYKVEHFDNPPTEHLKNEMQRKVIENQNDLIALFDEYFEEKKSILKVQSHKDYTNLRKALEDFQSLNGKINLSKIDVSTLNNFRKYLLEVRKLNNNTTIKRMVILKPFIKKLIKNKFVKPIDWEEVKKVEGTEVFIETLSFDEMKYIINQRGKVPQAYKKCLDLFIFQCLTSLRYSDLIKINKHNSVGGQIRILSEKTNKPIIINLSQTALTILQENDYNLNYYQNQPYNRKIHDMFNYFSLNVNSFKELVGTGLPRYQYFTSHTGRRTFITLQLLNSTPTSLVMLNTGHTRIQMLDKYVKRLADVKTNISQGLEDSLGI
jgi:integrase